MLYVFVVWCAVVAGLIVTSYYPPSDGDKKKGKEYFQESGSDKLPKQNFPKDLLDKKEKQEEKKEV
jgi:hypothetical protein